MTTGRYGGGFTDGEGKRGVFILTDRPHRADVAIGALVAALPIEAAPIHHVQLGAHTLVWTRAQARDNLHVHPDGVFIGRMAASEELSSEPIRHQAPLGAGQGTLMAGVVIRGAPRLVVEPLGTTLTFATRNAVSDLQLLLAAHDTLRPGATGVAMLAGIGYFPGTATLFDEVRRIPLLERWDVARGEGERTRQLQRPRPDDDAMIERLVSLVPHDVPHALGLSGGYDSRFILGILHRAKADVRLVRFTDGETDTVSAIARRLGLEVQGIGSIESDEDQHSPGEFALLTDAQIWHGIAQYGRMRRNLSPADMFHSGQFSDSLTKNTFKTAWKNPDPRTPFWDRLIEQAFLPNAPTVQPTLKAMADRADLGLAVRAALEGQRDYVDFRTKKQWANWLHYANRAMRWSQALYNDLTYSTNLVYLLSDLDAQLLGITSGFWPNFHNDRVAALNHRLLPTVDVGYSSGSPATPRRGPASAWTKLEYEYVQRLRTSRTARAHLNAIPTTYLDDLPADQPPGYDDLFDRPMREVAEQGRFGLRRANVTVSHVLTFLATVPTDAASAG